MPEYTLYSTYEPCFFGPLSIKGESWESDFLEMPLHTAIECEGSDDFFDILEDAEKNNKSIKMDLEAYGREGMFDEEQLYVVWEKEDVEKLIGVLNKCIKN